MTDDRSLTIALGTGPTDGSTVAALRLADAAAQRGHRVTVFAYGEGVRVGAEGCPTSSYVRCLLGDRDDADPAAAASAESAPGSPAAASAEATPGSFAGASAESGSGSAASASAESLPQDRPRPATWIVDAHDPRTSTQVPGVVRGDGSDLWRSVRDGDVVLGVTA